MRVCMTKEEFKEKWEGDENGGGITLDDIADRAIEWGVCSKPRAMPPARVVYQVLKAANVEDADEYDPARPEFNDE